MGSAARVRNGRQKMVMDNQVQAQAPEGGHKMRIPTPDQARQLLGAIRPREPFGARDFALIVLDMHTGLRAAELCGLNVGHVASSQGPREWLDLPAAIAKGKRGRQIPLNETARKAIAQILRYNAQHGFSVHPDAPLLVTKDHKRLPTRSLRDRIQRYRERVELDLKVSPHSLRHSLASRLASSCGNLRVVQKVLGHVRLNTVEIYTHTDAEEMQQAMDRLS